MRVQDSAEFVTSAEGQELKTKLGAYAFVECSAKRNENVSEVFEAAIRATLDKIDDKSKTERSKKCSIS